MSAEPAHSRRPESPDTPCGCTHCCRLFPYADIVEFWDSGFGEAGSGEAGATPVCPYCGLDTVLVSTADMIVDEHCLFAMRKTYY